MDVLRQVWETTTPTVPLVLLGLTVILGIARVLDAQLVHSVPLGLVLA